MLCLIEGALLVGEFRILAHESRDRVLHRRRNSEGQELVHLAKLRGERRRSNAIADLPSGRVVGLAKGEDRKCAIAQARVAEDTRMLASIEGEGFIDFVRQYANVRAVEQVRDPVLIRGGQYRPCRVEKAYSRPACAYAGLWSRRGARSQCRNRRPRGARAERARPQAQPRDRRSRSSDPAGSPRRPRARSRESTQTATRCPPPSP